MRKVEYPPSMSAALEAKLRAPLSKEDCNTIFRWYKFMMNEILQRERQKEDG